MCKTFIWQLKELVPWVGVKKGSVGNCQGNYNSSMGHGNAKNEDIE